MISKMEPDHILMQIEALEDTLADSKSQENMETLSFHEFNYQRINSNLGKYLQNARICHEKCPEKSQVGKKLLADAVSNYSSIFCFGG